MEFRGIRPVNKPQSGLFSSHYYTLRSGQNQLTSCTILKHLKLHVSQTFFSLLRWDKKRDIYISGRLKDKNSLRKENAFEAILKQNETNEEENK